MPSEFDASEFVDDDFQSARKQAYAAAGSTGAASGANAERPLSREEVDTKVGEVQHRLLELKRAQEELERERSTLEETRRRQMEFETGREEMLEHLTRGLGLLEESEFAARRDADQMAKALADLREALDKIQAIHQESWSQDNYNVELTRALTTIENARMEWNAARLKFSVLSGEAAREPQPGAAPVTGNPFVAPTMDFAHLCKLGLAITWPLALIALLGLGILVTMLIQRQTP